MNELGRPESVGGSLTDQVCGGEPAKLVVDERQHLITRPLVATAPVKQQSRNRTGRSFLRHVGVRETGGVPCVSRQEPESPVRLDTRRSRQRAVR